MELEEPLRRPFLTSSGIYKYSINQDSRLELSSFLIDDSTSVYCVLYCNYSSQQLAVVPLELFVAAIQSVRQRLAIAERHARPLPPSPSPSPSPVAAESSQSHLQPTNNPKSTTSDPRTRAGATGTVGGGGLTGAGAGAPLVTLLAELNARLDGVEREAVLLVHECLATRTEGVRELRSRWRTRVGETLLEWFPSEANQKARYWRQDPPLAAKTKKEGSKSGEQSKDDGNGGPSQPEPSEYMKDLVSEQLEPLFSALFSHYIRETTSDGRVNSDAADDADSSNPNALLWQLVQMLLDELCVSLMDLVLSQRIRFSLYGAILLQNDVLFLLDSIAPLCPTPTADRSPNAPNPNASSDHLFAARVRKFSGVRRLFECIAILLHQHVSDSDKSRRRPPLPPGASSSRGGRSAGGLCSCTPVVDDALIERAVSSNPYSASTSRAPLPPPNGSARSRLSRAASLESLASIELPPASSSAQTHGVEQRSRSRSRSRTASNAVAQETESQRHYARSPRPEQQQQQQQGVDVAAWKRLRARSPSPSTRAFFSFLFCN